MNYFSIFRSNFDIVRYFICFVSWLDICKMLNINMSWSSFLFIGLLIVPIWLIDYDSHCNPFLFDNKIKFIPSWFWIRSIFSLFYFLILKYETRRLGIIFRWNFTNSKTIEIFNKISKIHPETAVVVIFVKFFSVFILIIIWTGSQTGSESHRLQYSSLLCLYLTIFLSIHWFHVDF